jgi:hypothetical protein
MYPEESSMVTAGKQRVTGGFRGNSYARNNRGTVGKSVFCWAQHEAIDRVRTRQISQSAPLEISQGAHRSAIFTRL